MSAPDRLRVLVIAEQANPEWVSVPLEGWSHSQALARLADVHVVTHTRNEEAFRRAGAGATFLNSDRVAERALSVAHVLRGRKDVAGKGQTLLTAFRLFGYVYFDHLVWKAFGERIRRKEFDVVHRLTPLSPTVPTRLARLCARAGVPFVIGPLNGGVPWPKGFTRTRLREGEWLSFLREGYKLVPGYRSTRDHAAALVAGSRDTFTQLDERWRHKAVYVPENAIDPARFDLVAELPAPPPLRVAFVGRLVPYKGADMLIEAAAPLVKEGKVAVDIIGDGEEMASLRAQAAREGVGGGVVFAGWVKHADLKRRLAASHVFAFPSVREFGGAVVLEAMATGLVPIVVDHGGPGELVSPGSGFAVPIGSRESIVARFREILRELATNPRELQLRRARARERVLRSFTWDAKAAQMLEVYRWVSGRREKPDFGMPLRDPP